MATKCGVQSYLLVDLGGTNVRFCLMKNGRMSGFEAWTCKAFKSFEAALDAYTQKHARADNLVLALPAPKQNGAYHFVNIDWRFRLSSLKRHFGFTQVLAMNDFSANAWGLLDLTRRDVVRVGGGAVVAREPKVVIGAGTGLGVGVLVPTLTGWQALPSEAGHIAVSPTTQAEEDILRAVRERYGRISAERVVSGHGLSFLYEFLTGRVLSAPQIYNAMQQGDALAKQAFLQMFAFWGDVAGDLALAYCAKGGVYLAGGIIKKEGLSLLLDSSDFRQRFENKARHSAYVAQISTQVILSERLAFQGLRRCIIDKNKKIEKSTCKAKTNLI